MTILNIPEKTSASGPLFSTPNGSQLAWLLAGDWQEVHKNISRAFTENASSGGPNWVLVGLSLLVLVIVAVGGYYYYHSKQVSGFEFPGSAKPPKPQPSLPNGRRSGQKRDWVRVPAGFSIQYALVATDPAEGPSLHTARLVDISAGGCLLATRNKLNPGEKLKLMLDLPQIPEMVVTGRVVRLVSHLSEPPVFLTGIEFVNGSHGFRDKINKWVFSQQTRLINKKHWASQGLCILCGNLIPKSIYRNIPYCDHCLIGENEVSSSDSEANPTS